MEEWQHPLSVLSLSPIFVASVFKFVKSSFMELDMSIR